MKYTMYTNEVNQYVGVNKSTQMTYTKYTLDTMYINEAHNIPK